MLLVLSESGQATLWTRAIRPKARARLRVELLPLSTMGAHPVAPADRDDVSLNVRCSPHHVGRARQLALRVSAMQSAGSKRSSPCSATVPSGRNVKFPTCAKT